MNIHIISIVYFDFIEVLACFSSTCPPQAYPKRALCTLKTALCSIQKRHICTQKSHTYIQKSSIHTQNSPMFNSKERCIH